MIENTEEKELKLLIEKSENGILKWKKGFTNGEYFLNLPDNSKYYFYKGRNLQSLTSDYTLRFFDKNGDFIQEIYSFAIPQKNMWTGNIEHKNDSVFIPNQNESILYTLSDELYNLIINSSSSNHVFKSNERLEMLSKLR